MRIILLAIFLLLVSTLVAKSTRVTCYAKAGLGIYDVHGVHEGFGDNIREASADAMADCRSQHPFIGCIPVLGCK